MAKQNIKVNIKGEDLKKKLNIVDGKTPTKEELVSLIKPLIPPPTKPQEINTADIATQASKLAQIELESKIPTPNQIAEQMPVLGDKVRDSLELLNGADRLSRTAIDGLDDYEEISKLAREPKTVKKYYGGSGSSTSSGGGHTIQDDGTPLPQRTNLNFIGATVEDDEANNATNVTITGGGGSALSYLHTQSEASDTWVVNHSLGDLNPIVQVYSPDDEMVEPESITIDSSNQLTLIFGEEVTGKVRVLGTGGVSFDDTFETVSKNLKGNPFVLNYTGSQLTSMVYTLPDSLEITKTFAYTGSQLDSITLSGDTPSGIDLVKTLGYTDGKLTSVTYS